MTPAPTRREVVQCLAACWAVGCGSGNDSTAQSPLCTSPSDGSPTYCLVQAVVVRVPGVDTLVLGEAVLTNVDDNTAVIVGRDDAGYFARSAICTHACCIVALCADDYCSDPEPTPDTCGSAGPGAGTVLCPCHGSRFRLADGAVLNGPATVPLPSYALVRDGADALVDTGTPTDPSARA